MESRDGVFRDWKTFMDKPFPNMDPAFTSFFILKFKNGVVKYQELNQDGVAVTVKPRVFCADPVGTRKIILIELFNLNSTSDVVEICKAKPRCPPLPQKIISQKKVDNMKVLYQQIPSNCRWYYPEDEEVPFETHTDLRARAVKHGEAPAPSQQVEHEHGTVDPVAGAEGRLVPVAVAEDIVGVKGPHSYAYK